MRLERSEDEKRVTAVLFHPDIFPHVSDDGEERVFVRHPKLYYLMVQVDEPISMDGVKAADIGMVTFTPVNFCTWIPHVSILPGHRSLGLGSLALAVGMGWMWEHIPNCWKLVARPPAFNHAMIRVFEKCGFHREGRSPKSFMRHGVLHDRIYFGYERD